MHHIGFGFIDICTEQVPHHINLTHQYEQVRTVTGIDNSLNVNVGVLALF